MWRCDICGHRQDEGADADCPKCGMRQWTAVRPRAEPARGVCGRCEECGAQSARLRLHMSCPACDAARDEVDDREPPSGAAVCGLFVGMAVVWACTIRGLFAFLGY